MNVPQQQLIGSAEAADLLGIHKSTLTRWVKAGRITPAETVAGIYLFNRDHIERLAA